MALLTEARIAELLQPYVTDLSLPTELYEWVGMYLDLLVRWNARTNLTSVREPEQIVQRQVGESLFAAKFLSGCDTLLDFGSGAGFPGIPLQLALPGLNVTLAESQGKKASFLREAVRTLGLESEVWSGRVEAMDAQHLFSAVSMRAVDDSARMVPAACKRIAEGGQLLLYTGSKVDTAILDEWTQTATSLPLSAGRLVCARRPLFHVEHSE